MSELERFKKELLESIDFRIRAFEFAKGSELELSKEDLLLCDGSKRVLLEIRQIIETGEGMFINEGMRKAIGDLDINNN